jgi:hypothetical protein
MIRFFWNLKRRNPGVKVIVLDAIKQGIHQGIAIGHYFNKFKLLLMIQSLKKKKMKKPMMILLLP